MTLLKWGETPFDRMTPEELRMECLHMYSACEVALTVVNQFKFYMERDLGGEPPYFYNEHGVGRRALSKLKQVLQPIKEAHENTEWGFFRYADDLLFEGVGSGWLHCPTCKCFWGSAFSDTPVEKCPSCEGPVHPITWEDIKPNAPVEEP